jgi:hypothetical protein
MQLSKLVIGLDGRRLINQRQFNEFFLFCRLPFIENVEYIDLRRKIIKALVQIRVLVRNLRLVDQINMPKSKLILEVDLLNNKQQIFFIRIIFRLMNYEQQLFH